MARPKTIVGLGYVTRKIMLSKEDMSSFIEDVNKRQTSQQTVNNIYEGLKQGMNFSAPLVVHQSLNKNKWETIDGHHRIEALNKYFEEFPTHRVEVTLAIYQNLSDEQFKQIYTVWNKGRKQITNDVVRQYESEIPIYKLLKQRYPVKITTYPTNGSINFFKLIGAYYAAKHPGKFSGGYLGSAFEFIEEVKTLNAEDYKLLYAFMADYMKAFGPGTINNIFLKGTPLTALMRIWYDNRQVIAQQKLIKFFKRLENNDDVKALSKPSGRGACQYARIRFLDLLNAGRDRDLFIMNEGSPEAEEDSEEYEGL